MSQADGINIKVGGGQTLTATVFNIKSYRLITIIDYEGGTILICECLTHGEYDLNLWKGRL